MILDGAGVELYVSVPFRGSCSEICKSIACLVYSIAVSVPFRGSCSEIRPYILFIFKVFRFRPLSGFVF